MATKTTKTATKTTETNTKELESRIAELESNKANTNELLHIYSEILLLNYSHLYISKETQEKIKSLISEVK